MTSSRVLVTDGHLRASLAVVRSLGRAGHRVYVCSPRRRSLAGASRYAVAESCIPSALTDASAFADAVAELTRRWSVSVVLPMSEESLLVLLPRSATLGAVQIPFASLDRFRLSADKQYVLSLAASLGITVPRQIVLAARALGVRVDTGNLRFPVVVKPARSVAGDGAERAKFGVTYADDHAALTTVLSATPSSAFPLLLQERITGPGTGIFFLRWNSRIVAQFAHRRLREKPPSGGVSVCAESVAMDPELARQARTLIEALDWRGPAMVEFKIDRDTGRAYLMEINGRFWGSLQLAIDAGVDFPALLVALATGEPVEPVTSYEIGVRCRWWWGEVDHLISRLGRPTAQYGLNGRWGALKRFLRPERGARNEILRAADPLPFVRESVDWFRGQ